MSVLQGETEEGAVVAITKKSDFGNHRLVLGGPPGARAPAHGGQRALQHVVVGDQVARVVPQETGAIALRLQLVLPRGARRSLRQRRPGSLPGFPLWAPGAAVFSCVFPEMQPLKGPP